MIKVEGENGIILTGLIDIICDEFDVGKKKALTLLVQAIKTDNVLYEIINQICYIENEVVR